MLAERKHTANWKGKGTGGGQQSVKAATVKE
jgi:hypothetical protein